MDGEMNTGVHVLFPLPPQHQQNAFVDPQQCALRPLVPLYWITFWTSGDLSLGHVLALC